MDSFKMYDAMSKIDGRLIDRSLNRKIKQTNNENILLTSHRKAALKKFVPVAISILLVAALSVSAAVIAFNSKQADQMLKIGFDYGSGEPLNSARIAVIAERSKLNVGDDLPVSIYSICSSKDDINVSSVTARIFMSYSRIDPDNMIETVKVIDDGKAAGYNWSGDIEQLKSEKTVVPAAVFTKADNTTDINGLTETDGVIVWALEVNKMYSDGSECTEQDSVALYYKIEEDEIYLQPSEETMALAKTAVEKLQIRVVFMPGVNCDFNHTLYDEYEYTAKWVAPELITLETKDDSSLALINLYEEMLEEYKTCDLDWYRENVKPGFEPDDENREKLYKIAALGRTRMVIEALLALDCYYFQLGEQSVQRMMNDFAEYAAVEYASFSKYYDDVSNETMFDMYRGGRYDNSGLYVIE